MQVGVRSQGAQEESSTHFAATERLKDIHCSKSTLYEPMSAPVADTWRLREPLKVECKCKSCQIAHRPFEVELGAMLNSLTRMLLGVREAVRKRVRCTATDCLD